MVCSWARAPPLQQLDSNIIIFTSNQCSVAILLRTTANPTIPRVAGLESPEILQRYSKMRHIAVESIQNRHPNCNLSMLEATLESHGSASPDSRFRGRPFPWKMPENSKKVFPVPVLNFGYISAFQCCTGSFKVPPYFRKAATTHLESSPASLRILFRNSLM